MKFTPLKFQGTLAASGVALMPYIFIKINIFKNEGEISLAKLSLLAESPLDFTTALFLIAIMALFIVIHLTLTALFLKSFLYGSLHVMSSKK